MKSSKQQKPHGTQTDRQKRIMELVQRDGHVRVNDLSRLLNVAEITIRRDLAYMENRNLLERTHGGAISLRRISHQVSFSNRSDIEIENKDAIAKAAAELIEDGDTVFINGGSTTFHIFRYIQKKDVTVVTTNASSLSQVLHQNISLIVAGGEYFPESNSFYGGITNNIINQINASKAILGVHGISLKYGLTSPMYLAAETTRLMIDRTRGEIIIVADHRKIGLVSDYVTSSINRISTLIIDYFPDKEYLKNFTDMGIRVIETCEPPSL